MNRYVMPNGTVCHIDNFGDNISYRIDVRGKWYYFDWSDRFGWNRLKLNGHTAKSDVPRYVGDEIQKWYDQGKKIGDVFHCGDKWGPDFATCLYETSPKKYHKPVLLKKDTQNATTD